MNRKWRIVYRLQLQPNILKRPVMQTIIIQLIKAGFVVKLNFFAGLQFQATLGQPTADLPAAGYFKGKELCKLEEDDINKNFDKFTDRVFPDSYDYIQQKLQNNETKNLERA
jgi:hypothetical protein